MPIFILAGGFQPVLKRTLATKIRVNTLPDASFSPCGIEVGGEGENVQLIHRQPSISPARKGVNSSEPMGKDAGAGVS